MSDIGTGKTEIRKRKRIVVRCCGCILAILFAVLLFSGCGIQTDPEQSPRLADIRITAENEGTIDSQYVTVDLNFDRGILPEKEPLENMHITIAGVAVPEPGISQPEENTLRIRIPVTAVTTGNLKIEEKKENGGFPGIRDVTGKYAVLPFAAEMLIPTGVVLEDDPSYEGSGVAKVVTGQWNIRCITWMQLLEDGEPLESVVSQSSERYRENSIAVHGHDFLMCDSTMIAGIMAETLNRHFGNRYVFYQEGNRLIGEKLDAGEAGVPDLKIYEYQELQTKDPG